ncbi:hypothetical protein FO519_010122, partial [Halicephalobus sp. NKZ332]
NRKLKGILWKKKTPELEVKIEKTKQKDEYPEVRISVEGEIPEGEFGKVRSEWESDPGEFKEHVEIELKGIPKIEDIQVKKVEEFQKEIPSESFEVEPIQVKAKKQKGKIVTKPRSIEEDPGFSLSTEIHEVQRTIEIEQPDVSQEIQIQRDLEIDPSSQKIQVEVPRIKDYPDISERFQGELLSLQKSSEVEPGTISEHINFKENDDSEGSYKLNSKLRSIKRKHVALAETPEFIVRTSVPPGYPEPTSPFKGEINEISKYPEAPSTDLFECISFGSEVEEQPKPTTLQKLLLPVFLCAAPSKKKKTKVQNEGFENG